MPKQTTFWPPGKRSGPAMVSACQSPANIPPPPGVLSLYAGPGRTTAAPLWATTRLQEQPATLQRPGHRVFWSSHHPAARNHSRGKPSTKQRTPKGTRPHPFPLGQLPENQATNAPAKYSPPDNSHGVLNNTNTPQQLQCQLARDKAQGWHPSRNADTGCCERRHTLRSRSILCNRWDRQGTNGYVV